MTQARRLLFVLLLVSHGAWAETPPLGRLFFTPAERTALDQNAPPPSNLPRTTLNGRARNLSTGQETVWINGQHWYRPTAHSNAHSPSLRSASGQSLKVGDSLVNNHVVSNLPPGAIRQP